MDAAYLYTVLSADCGPFPTWPGGSHFRGPDEKSFPPQPTQSPYPVSDGPQCWRAEQGVSHLLGEQKTGTKVGPSPQPVT